MSEMVERVARAICAADCLSETPNELARCRDLACAAIGAMRDPTDEMTWAGGTAMHDNHEDSTRVFQAMVEAALTNKP